MKIRVYYEDTDCGNVVYYANYLKYMERSRTELMREHGIHLADLHREGYLFAVVHADIRYRASARYDDVLTVESEVSEMTSVSIVFRTTIHNEHGTLLVVGDVKLACINSKGRACRLPAMIKAHLGS
ncbi:MAG: YbgC/FadM family acyl-CoA thioesterase [Chitinivibrionales bacterium]|nr:YbgC/FadM family acyl-CoA thioesterase [Chitinivibrionales bacterium]